MCKPCKRVQSGEWRRNNPDKKKNQWYKSAYGITLEEYKKMKSRQNNKCAICKDEAKLHVDHCHVTNQVRGLLCHHCNTMLGLGRDNVSTFAQAILYINTHAGILDHLNDNNSRSRKDSRPGEGC